MKATSILLWLFAQMAWAAEPVVLRFSWWGASDRHEVTQKALRLFEQRHPGVRIRAEASAFDQYEDRLAGQLQAGAEPDVMQINWSWISSYSPRGEGFGDLYRQRGLLRLDEFTGESFKSGLSFGKLNGLPASYTAYVFLWQKTTFDRAGIPLPRTWEQLFLAAQIMREKLGADYYLLDGDPRASYMLSHAYIQQKTGKPYIYSNQPRIGLTHQELLDWVRFHRRLHVEHVIVPHAHRQRLPGRALQQQPEWVAGRWAGTYTYDSTLRARTSTLPKATEVEVGDFLSMSGAKNSGMFGRPAMMLAVSRHSKYPEQASRLVNFLLTDADAARLLGNTRGIPLANTAYQVVVPQLQPYERKAFEQIRAARINYPSPYQEHQAIHALLSDVFVRVGRQQISDDEAAMRLLDEGNRLLRQLAVRPQ